MTGQRLEPVVLEGKRIVFRNFAGAVGRFNAEGDRNFNVLLDDEEAERMIADGWNIKWLQPREEGDKPQARLDVAVSYKEKTRPPRIVLLTSRGKTSLDEDRIGLLDWADIVNVDLILNPYHWSIAASGKSGIKAYLKSLYVTIREDELELKYMDVPDSAASIMVGDAEGTEQEQ